MGDRDGRGFGPPRLLEPSREPSLPREAPVRLPPVEDAPRYAGQPLEFNGNVVIGITPNAELRGNARDQHLRVTLPPGEGTPRGRPAQFDAGFQGGDPYARYQSDRFAAEARREGLQAGGSVDLDPSRRVTYQAATDFRNNGGVAVQYQGPRGAAAAHAMTNDGRSTIYVQGQYLSPPSSGAVPAYTVRYGGGLVNDVPTGTFRGSGAMNLPLTRGVGTVEMDAEVHASEGLGIQSAATLRINLFR